MPFGCLTYCKAGTYTILINDKEYTFELIDISTKDYGYSYFEVWLNNHKIGSHQCQGNDCEETIRKKVKKYLREKVKP